MSSIKNNQLNTERIKSNDLNIHFQRAALALDNAIFKE